MSIDANQWVTLGKVTTVFGIKGWVKIHSYTQPESNLFEYAQMRLHNPQTQQSQDLSIQNFQKHGKGYIAKVNNCDDRNDAMQFTQQDIQVPSDMMPELDSDEYYWHELEGLSVWAQADELSDADQEWLCLGEVSHLLETGANDVLVVQANNDSIDQRERLIPYIDQVVRRVALEEKRIEISWDINF